MTTTAIETQKNDTLSQTYISKFGKMTNHLARTSNDNPPKIRHKISLTQGHERAGRQRGFAPLDRLNIYSEHMGKNGTCPPSRIGLASPPSKNF